MTWGLDFDFSAIIYTAEGSLSKTLNPQQLKEATEKISVQEFI